MMTTLERLHEADTAESYSRYREVLKKQLAYYSDFQERLGGCPDAPQYFGQLRERVEAHINVLGTLLARNS